MIRYPRILFYAVNGLGLGHVTRLLAIARKLRVRAPEAEIVFLTSSEAEDVIYREGFAAFKVPSKTLRFEAHLRPSTYARMMQTVVLNLLASFHPHVLVVDTFPAGTMQELLPVLRWDSRKVFVFRVQRPEIAESALVQNTLALYNLAVVPHHEGEERVPLPPGLDACWAGPIMIRDRDDARPRDEARAILGLPADGPVVYVAFGGGGDCTVGTSLDATLDALAANPMRDAMGVPVHLAVAAAPLFRGRVVQRPCVTRVDYYPIAELFAAFDAAVSAAGYNSATEFLHHGVPTAFVPFARQVDDQEGRAMRIEEAGAGLCLPELDAAGLRAAVARLLDPATAAPMREHARALAPTNGADRAAEAILALAGY
jgi:UDP-N-acetylglucosamine--N-acetylmuramyl-(pentapeptide) pyrophosphoryl-undecaprenol N-acetylglucosamine transferase